MKSQTRFATLGAGALAVFAGVALAQVSPGRNEVSITTDGGQRCVASNGTPNHAIGQFPTRGNPHSFRPRALRYCVDAEPRRNPSPTRGTAIVAVLLNGVPVRPGTADWYDPNSRRGASRDPSSGWNLEGMGSADVLGMDQANGHVDHTGLYHYHGAPVAIGEAAQGTLVGYAADGFELHYVGSRVRPSWRLRAGERRTAPFGPHDGRFVEDWEYVAGSGDLDECNGGMLNGRYVYFATAAYPFYPRCHWGDVSADFVEPGGPRGGPARGGPGRGGPARGGPGRGGPGRGGPGQGERQGGGGPLAAAAAELGVSERALADAVGPPPPNVRRAARILGVSEARLRDVLRRHRPR